MCVNKVLPYFISSATTKAITKYDALFDHTQPPLLYSWLLQELMEEQTFLIIIIIIIIKIIIKIIVITFKRLIHTFDELKLNTLPNKCVLYLCSSWRSGEVPRMWASGRYFGTFIGRRF